MRWLAILLVGVLSGALPACGDDDDDIGSDGDADADADADADGDSDVPAEYPAPPYGVVEGDIIENLQFIGADNEIVDLASFHNDPDAKLIMVFATAGWCYWCSVEQEVLINDWDPNYGPQGLRIFGVVFEDEDAQPADSAYANEYFGPRGYNVDYTYAADYYFKLGRFFDDAATPLNMFIRTDTMEIVAMELGWGEDAYREIIEYWLAGGDDA